MKTIIIILLVLLMAGCSTPIVVPAPSTTPSPVPTIEPFEPVVIEFTAVDVSCHKTVAANATGATIVLCENKLANKPTKAELETFLNTDLTDEIPYEAPEWTCADYVREVHNNAELAGIKCYMVGVFPTSSDPMPHALLGVDTTDNGTVYVDCMFDAWVWAKVGSVMVYTNLRPTMYVYSEEQASYEVKSIMVIRAE
jgi:hypothetical protein